MSRKDRWTADFLFVVQILLATFFCGSQFAHLLTNSARGVSVAMFVSVELFATINLVLAIKAHKVKPSRVTYQNKFTYGFWTAAWGINMVVVLAQLIANPSEIWSPSEYTAIFAVVTSLTLVYWYSKKRGLPYQDPIVRGLNALVFKSVPQLFQAWKFFVFGGAGWSGWAVLGGHATISTRLGQLVFSLKEKKEDRNRIGSAISEIGNEISWLVATAVWVWWRFF